MWRNDPSLSLLKGWAKNFWSLLSALSVLLTFFPSLQPYSWFLVSLGIAGLFVSLYATARKEIKTRDEEIRKLKIKPFDIALESDVNQKLQEFTDEGKKVLKYILINGPLRAETRKVPNVQDTDKSSALNTGYRNGLIERKEVEVGNRPETDWDIKEQFKPVLKQLLFSTT